MDSHSDPGMPFLFLDDAQQDSTTDHPSNRLVYRPGSRSTYAHDWSPAGTGGKIELRGRHFVDTHGRVCNLRGVNVSGASKIPVNHDHDAFPANHNSVSFVGRPFPLEEAPQHFARLRRWGLSFIRVPITWEAVEHAGPGIYDTEYLAYIKSVLSLLPEYGLTAVVVFHQDVWSRYSGGSGAPAWTLENIGFDLHALEESRAAWLSGVKGGGHVESERGVWTSGYQKLAAATMATCFWAGDTFAPKLKVTAPNGDVKSAQQYLQDAFLDMCELVAQTLAGLDGVIGYQFFNEPHRGYVDLPSLHKFNYNTDLHVSYVPSAFQSFMLGSGYPTSVAHWTRTFPMPTRVTSHTILNSERRSAWRLDGPTQGKCVWEMHGVWGWDKAKDEGVVLREHYFAKHPVSGRKVDWYTDFYFPFSKRWAERLQGVFPKEKMYFVEPIPNEFCPPSWTKENRVPNMVFAPHWYDLNVNFTKAFGDFTVNVQGLSRGMFPLKGIYWGQKGARDNYTLQIQNIIDAGHRSLGETPILIGECGVPMHINDGEAFTTESWTWQYRMMDALMTALERSLASFALWHYDPDNSDVHGDHWNGENFSWFSRKRALPPSLLEFEQDSFTLDNGGRILPAIVRPYPAKTAGIPLRFEYDMNTANFTFEWTLDEGCTSRETEIFIPSVVYYGRRLIVEGLARDDKYVYDESRQTLFVVQGRHTRSKTRRINVSVRPPLGGHFYVNTFLGDFGELIVSGSVVFVGIFLFVKYGFYGMQ